MPRKSKDFISYGVIPCRPLDLYLPVGPCLDDLPQLHNLPLISIHRPQSFISNEILVATTQWVQELPEKPEYVLVTQNQFAGPFCGKITLVAPIDIENNQPCIQDVLEFFRGFKERTPIAFCD